jgi:hypothetical protein
MPSRTSTRGTTAGIDARGGGAMIAPAELAGFWSRMADLDEEIALTHAEGYCVDGLLDERLDWQREREEVMERCTGT